MLLAQKSYCEGALALELYCARLVDETAHRRPRRRGTGPAAAGGADTDRQELAQRMVPGGQQLAIQVHGGYGYTRDFPVEQYWRDNRLNMIHEGTHGIQGLDLLGARCQMEGRICCRPGQHASTPRWKLRWPPAAGRLPISWRLLVGAGGRGHQRRPGQPVDPAVAALANAVPYLQAFGHLVLAWIWLDVMRVPPARRPPGPRAQPPGRSGRPLLLSITSCPNSPPGCRWSGSRDLTCANLPEEAF
jgi:hypothetical protein